MCWTCFGGLPICIVSKNKNINKSGKLTFFYVPEPTTIKNQKNIVIVI